MYSFSDCNKTARGAIILITCKLQVLRDRSLMINVCHNKD